MPSNGSIPAVCRDARIGPQNTFYAFASLAVFDFSGGGFATTTILNVNIGQIQKVPATTGIYQIVWSVVDRKAGGTIPSFNFATYGYFNRTPVGADFRILSCHVVNEQTTWIFVHDASGALADPANATDRVTFLGMGRRTKVPFIDWVGLMREMNFDYGIGAIDS